MKEPSQRRRPILALDFDGVIHDYLHGWGTGEIYGNATPGFFDWAIEASEKLELVIHSSRTADAQGRQMVLDWLQAQAALQDRPSAAGLLTVSATKPPALMTIDDRCVTFRGDWSDPEVQPEAILKFKPWMKAP
jgi:hypothetical protein